MVADEGLRRVPEGLGPALRVVFVGIGVASLVLGYVGLRQLVGDHPELGTAVLDLVYWDLQLFVLDSTPLQGARDLPPALQIARFTAPATTAYAVFAAAHAMLGQQARVMRARRSRGHTVVCGSEPAVVFLTRQLLADGRRVVVIDPGLADGGSVGSQPAAPGRALAVAGDPRDVEVLRRAGAHRAREVMALTSDSAFNAEVALALGALVAGSPSPVVCYAEVDDRDLCAALVARTLSTGDTSDLAVEFFSRHDRAARRLLERSSLLAGGGDAPAVLVAGRGPLARAVVVELARRWDREVGDGGRPLPVAVLDAGVTRDAVVARSPLPSGAVTIDARPTDPAAVTSAAQLAVGAGASEDGTDRGCRPPTHVFVCLDDDAAGLRFGLVVSELLAKHAPEIVVAVAEGTVFGRTLAGGTRATGRLAGTGARAVDPARADAARLILHNVTETVYSAEVVRQGMVDDIARAAHSAYIATCTAAGDTVETNGSIVPWDELPDDLRAANRAQAADIGRKLAAIGCAAVPRTVGAAPFAFSDDEIEHLARLEHDRWMRERRAQGWTHGTPRDDARKLHPDLVDWEALSEPVRDKDRSAVRAIPDELRAAGFAIVRRPA
jgi:voltage-gated potassium channel Kch